MCGTPKLFEHRTPSTLIPSALSGTLRTASPSQRRHLVRAYKTRTVNEWCGLKGTEAVPSLSQDLPWGSGGGRRPLSEPKVSAMQDG